MTAVEWLYEAIDNELIDFLENRININELSIAMINAKHQALEMEKKAKYETECYWYGRGINAGRENKIEELKPKKD